MNKSTSIVRRVQTAIEQRSKASDENQAVRPSNLWLRATTWTLMGTAVVAIAFLGLAQTEEVFIATGQLKPDGYVK